MNRFLLMMAVGCLAATATAREGDCGRVESEARGQAAEADRLFQKGEFQAALPLYEAERASRAALGDLRYEAYALRAVGCCLAESGQIDDAIAAWRDTIKLDARRDDRGFEGYDWLLIGNVELRRERFAPAIETLERAVPLLSQAIDRDHETDAQRLLARALAEQGRPEAARPHLDRAWTLARALNDPKRSADVAAESGRVALLLDEPGFAVEWLIDAQAEYRLQERTSEAEALDRPISLALIDLERADVAAALTEQAVTRDERQSDFPALADDLGFLSALKSDAGDLPAARTCAQ